MGNHIVKPYHLQSTPYNTGQDIRVPQLLLCPPIIWQFHEIRQWILLKDKPKALPILTPACHYWRHVHENLEADFADHLGRLTEIGAVTGVRFRKEVLDQTHTDVVAHAVKLGVDSGIVCFGAAGGQGEVAAERGYNGAVGQGDDFSIDFVDAGSLWSVSRFRWTFRMCIASLTSTLCAAVSQLVYNWQDRSMRLTLRRRGRICWRPWLCDECTLPDRAREYDNQLITRSVRKKGQKQGERCMWLFAARDSRKGPDLGASAGQVELQSRKTSKVTKFGLGKQRLKIELLLAYFTSLR